MLVQVANIQERYIICNISQASLTEEILEK